MLSIFRFFAWRVVIFVYIYHWSLMTRPHFLDASLWKPAEAGTMSCFWAVFPLEIVQVPFFFARLRRKIHRFAFRKHILMIFWRAAGGIFGQFIDWFPFRNSHFGVPESENFPAAGGGQNFGSRVRLLKTKGGQWVRGTISSNSTDHFNLNWFSIAWSRACDN